MLIDDKDIYSLFDKNGTAKLHVADIDLIRRVDAVEVVRCEHCIHKVDFKGRVMCSRRAHRATFNNEWYGLTATDNNAFCSYGERKDGAGE